MTVFTLPSYQTVFKIIKDRFAPQKDITRDQVKEKYYVVKTHDRVGRMADTQEFMQLRVAARALFTGADRRAENRRGVVGHAERRPRDHQASVRGAADDAAQPLPRNRQRRADARSARRIRQRDQATRCGEHLSRRHAAEELRRDATRPRRVLRLRRNLLSHRRQLPRAPDAAQQRRGDLGRDRGTPSDRATCFRRSSAVFCSAARASRSCSRRCTASCSILHYWQGLQRAIRNGEVMDVFPYRRKKRFARHHERAAASRSGSS